MTGTGALSARQLQAYLARIGLHGLDRPGADLPTLQAVVAAHARTIPFENLDVQLGRPVATDIGGAFAKLVTMRRGGWCYEQNGVLGAALQAMGYAVTRISAGVMREVRGEAAMASHLCLLVELAGKPWLVDAGFGGFLDAPLPLQEGAWLQPPLPVALGRTADGMWRLRVAVGENAMSYDFFAQPADEGHLTAMCQWQASSPASVFVQNLTAQRRVDDRYLMLRGKVLSVLRPDGKERREIASADALVACLREQFDLDLPEAGTLWPAIEARHHALFSPQAAPTT